MNRKTVGRRAESFACNFLTNHGMRLLTRNFHCRRGEIDLVMQDGDSLVFVEVRYRKTPYFGRAAETVSRTKQTRIIHCARYYLQISESWNTPARFDVVSLEGNEEAPRVNWIKNAFQPGS